ncbi:PREDICTED: uncharacterized protein LOC104588507 isoform X1 [Nelumbo nucifera]|uniref:Uncharacterized protein n=2 Tax=Nelumbo nucifera TaxID=4432 RepID=A0A822ZNN0_NELNU|nr:PREDICTED: uncharacterized protein LOC104588507 isoform X1 [Nelumbo nucifera]DAD45115.1 TPA_asm: hypothetical protein HUJ06_003345 [Nelumbo nucifera]
MNKRKKSIFKGVSSSSVGTDSADRRPDFRQIMKDVEYLVTSDMTWKERKHMENRRVAEQLGGKPQKKHRVPLSVARVTMKKQKEREQKMLEDGLILGHFGHKHASSNKAAEKHKTEDRVLKSSEGYFRNGVLDVKHLLRPATSRDRDNHTDVTTEGKKRKRAGKQRKEVRSREEKSAGKP